MMPSDVISCRRRCPSPTGVRTVLTVTPGKGDQTLVTSWSVTVKERLRRRTKKVSMYSKASMLSGAASGRALSPRGVENPKRAE